MDDERPIAAFILSLIGGIFILVAGFIISAIGAILTYFMMGIGAIAGLMGSICGIVIIICALALYTKPRENTVCGALIIVFSALSLFGAGGGFLVGFILSLIGGILAIIWKPSPPPPYYRPPPPQPKEAEPSIQYCPNCGRELRYTSRFCPYCGTKLKD